MKQVVITQRVTTRESRRVDTYLQEIKKIELLTPEQEVELTIRIKKGDKDALDKLVKANLRFVVSVAKQYQHTGLSLLDLINEGNIGLIKAAKNFDETKGFKFISYAVWWIRQSIMLAITEHTRSVRLPMNKVNEISKLKQAEEKLEFELERAPDESELAIELDMSISDVHKMISLSKKQKSMDAPVSEDSETSLLNLINNKDSSRPDESLLQDSLKSDVKTLLKNLTETEGKVLIMHFGLQNHESASLGEISERLKISKARVGQIKNEAIRKLRKPHLMDLLRPYLS